MIRQATPADLPRIRDLLDEMHGKSKFADRMKISATARDEFLLMALGRVRSRLIGGTFFHVYEQGGEVMGFLIGILDRYYHITNKLAAQDIFIYMTDGARPSGIAQLVEAYVAWGLDNPKVIVVNIAWTDIIPGFSKIERLFERKGFARCGGIFERVGGQ